MNPGKLFEQDFVNSMPLGAYAYRLKDCPAWVSQCECPGGGTRFTPANDYDFAVFWSGNLWALELKSVKGVSLRFDALRENQANGLFKAATFPGVHAGVLVEFRQVEQAWFVPILNWAPLRLKSGKKSLNYKELVGIATRINGRRKRVRMQWDVASFLARRGR